MCKAPQAGVGQISILSLPIYLNFELLDKYLTFYY